MKHIHELADRTRPRDWRKGSQYLGVEIEVENCPHDYLRPITDMGWSFITDGSLRNNGREIVSSPITLSKLEEDLPQIYRTLFEATSARPSVRTGTHVHLDMLDRTFDEVAAICTLYCLAEPALYASLPQDRDLGIYCVPWYRAPNQAQLIANLYASKDVKGNYHAAHMYEQLNHVGVKYSGLNVIPLTTLGTLEFRMAPTWVKQQDLLKWVKRLMRMARIGAELGTPEGVLDAVSKKGLKNVYSLPNIEELAEEFDGYYGADLIGGRDELVWESVVLNVEPLKQKPKPKKKKARVGEYATIVLDDQQRRELEEARAHIRRTRRELGSRFDTSIRRGRRH